MAFVKESREGLAPFVKESREGLAPFVKGAGRSGRGDFEIFNMG